MSTVFKLENSIQYYSKSADGCRNILLYDPSVQFAGTA